MEKKMILDIIEKIIKQLKELNASSMQENCPIGIISMKNWEWPQGVALFAMYKYYNETGHEEIFEYLVDWFDYQIQNGLPDKNVNTMCPMLTLTYIYEKTNEKKYLNLLKEWANYAMNDMPRTEEGGFQHCVSGHLNEGQLWDDTLYMTVLFINRMGIILEDTKYKQESIRQFLVHIKYLTDNKTGLMFHGWTFNGRHNFAKALWGRGNSWYTAGLVDYIEMADLPEGVVLFLMSTLMQQVKMLEKVQGDNGLWHTLLDDKSSYYEISCSAAFGYGILKAARKGYIDQKYLQVGLKALRGVLKKIDLDGNVHGVSYGTPVFFELDDYKKIPISPMPYGQSMALLLLVEALKNIE